jgi:hypothetical protein
MALQLTKTLTNGFSGNYWRIESARLIINDEAVYTLALYKDQATRNTPGSTPILRLPVTGAAITEVGTEDDIRAAWYVEIKTSHMVDGVEQNPFALATDI